MDYFKGFNFLLAAPVFDADDLWLETRRPGARSGISTIVPTSGSRKRAKPMVDYLKMFETCFNTFPSFDVKIQGVYKEMDANGRIGL